MGERSCGGCRRNKRRARMAAPARACSRQRGRHCWHPSARHPPCICRQCLCPCHACGRDRPAASATVPGVAAATASTVVASIDAVVLVGAGDALGMCSELLGAGGILGVRSERPEQGPRGRVVRCRHHSSAVHTYARTRVGENTFFVFSFRFLFQLSMFAMSFQNWYSVGCAVLCELGRDKTYKTCGPEITKRVPKITRTKRRIREYQTPQLHWSKGWSGYFLKALQTQFFALHNTV